MYLSFYFWCSTACQSYTVILKTSFLLFVFFAIRGWTCVLFPRVDVGSPNCVCVCIRNVCVYSSIFPGMYLPLEFVRHADRYLPLNLYVMLIGIYLLNLYVIFFVFLRARVCVCVGGISCLQRYHRCMLHVCWTPPCPGHGGKPAALPQASQLGSGHVEREAKNGETREDHIHVYVPKCVCSLNFLP